MDTSDYNVFGCTCSCFLTCFTRYFPQYLNRMVVKSSSAVFRIPELDFEIPAGTQKGQVTTVESILSRTIENLRQDQPYRMVR